MVPKGPGLPNGLISDLVGWLITNIIEGASFLLQFLMTCVQHPLLYTQFCTSPISPTIPTFQKLTTPFHSPNFVQFSHLQPPLKKYIFLQAPCLLQLKYIALFVQPQCVQPLLYEPNLVQLSYLQPLLYNPQIFNYTNI